ncbi:transglycosylase SLT domain-containing protein [Candidatus Gottesmanbacteria bacterium]|nr:transglycosylase SLT domain-containing protein [Candidatus Gottesmanbacteria bacterium]
MIAFLVTAISILFVSLSNPNNTQLVSQVPAATITPSPSPTNTPIPTKTPTPTLKPTSTPTPTLTPTPIIVKSNQFDEWFSKYSNEYGIDRNTLQHIAVCESKLNPNAKNRDYAGLFQFASNTWQTTRNNMGTDNNSDLRFNPEEAIKTAAYKISNGGINAWKNCIPSL